MPKCFLKHWRHCCILCYFARYNLHYRVERLASYAIGYNISTDLQDEFLVWRFQVTIHRLECDVQHIFGYLESEDGHRASFLDSIVGMTILLFLAKLAASNQHQHRLCIWLIFSLSSTIHFIACILVRILPMSIKVAQDNQLLERFFNLPPLIPGHIQSHPKLIEPY